MLKFSNLKIQNKLRILSFFSLLSLVILGFVSNYFYHTGKTLSLMINAERVHNNTFQEGIEDFYEYQLSHNEKWLNKALIELDTANQMAYNFARINQLTKLPKDTFVNVLFKVYKRAYGNDRSNAVLMADRLKLMNFLAPRSLYKAISVAQKGYILGEQIRTKVQGYKFKSQLNVDQTIDADLTRMRAFYTKFSDAISELIHYTNNLLYIGIILVVMLLVMAMASISALISKSITVPVSEMVNNFRIMARGNINTELSIFSENEMGKLADSFRHIQQGIRGVVAYTRKVAAGDYSSQIVPLSEEDELSMALNKMVEKLKESYEQTEKDSWFKSGINSLNDRLSGNQNLKEVSSRALSFILEFLHSDLGSIYMYDPEFQGVKLLNASGFNTEKLIATMKLNEGIPGQVAFTRQMRMLSDIPNNSYVTYSSAGEYKPGQIVVIPLLFNETLVGVLELASVDEFTDLELQFLEEAGEIIAINLQSAESNRQTKELLHKTQEQAGELQVQQEELRVANEELVEHAKVLTENEKKLQVQQEELRVANEELEERTRQLEIQKDDISNKNNELTEISDKLEIKARELEQANQYKSEFLANMSHELRTPLNSLLILSNILVSNKKGNLTDDQIQSAKIIHKSGSDLLHLINEILDLSKIEAGKMNIVLDSVKASDLKEEVLMNFKATAEDKDLIFNVQVDKNFPSELITDKYRLMQILKNLLSNAFKFTSKGSVSIDFVRTPEQTTLRRSELTVENTCCIKVSDTGVGIPTDKLESIFDAFQQADGSISRKFGGTGLGLSISRELIRILGGEIQLESEAGAGSTFYVYLPVNLEKSESSGKEVEIKDVGKEEKKKERTKKPSADEVPVQFIEDDRDKLTDGRNVLIIHPSKKQAGKFLQQARVKNFRAIVAQNIKDGIVLAEKYRPNAIMLAIKYAKGPDYNKLKSHRLTGKLPVHVITPIDYDAPEEHNELKTLETIEFTDALNSLDDHLSTAVRKMLIVEDNKMTRSVMKTMLAGLDLEISEAEKAEQAYDILCHDQFDCIILDLGLPDYSGKELLEKLKSNKQPIPKVIIYTGKDISQEEVKELNQFTDTIILKGIKSDERLMDEITLFLHQVSKHTPGVKDIPSIANDIELFKGKKILVVDDDIRNVFALGQMLEERDIDVVEADNGQSAIETLKQNNDIDLILMDVMMPVMNGYEAMQVIRKMPEFKEIPIICLTAKAMKEDHSDALKHGANDYLSKPLNEDKLFSMLKIWLYQN